MPPFGGDLPDPQSTSMAAAPPPGVYVPVPTFFSRSASNYNSIAAPLDLKTQAAHAIHLAKCGIKGLVILGSAGEAVGLTSRERFLVLSSVRMHLKGQGLKTIRSLRGRRSRALK